MKSIPYFLTLLCIVLTACGQTETKTDNRLVGMDAEIEELIGQHHAAGIAIAVIKDGKTMYSGGFGYRDYENKLPVDENTIFGIGSCTKAFTAGILGGLEAEGKLSFSDQPNKFLSELEFYSAGMNDSISIKNLLTHTTGLNSMPSESTAILFITPDKYELIPRIKHIKPVSGVGKDWIYNNLMYSLAGMVAEKASGITLEENWKQRIFNPLGMSHSYVGWKPASGTTNFSHGYAVDSITPVRVLQEDMSTRGAGGSIYSSVKDMSKWMQLWLDNGKFEDRAILPEEYIAAAQDTLALLPSNPNDSIAVSRHYGYGWFNWNHKGYQRSEHSGGTSGYVSNVVLYPQEDLGIVVLSNQTTTSLPSMVTNRIVERLYPELKENELKVQYGQSFTIAPLDTPTIGDKNDTPAYELSEVVGEYSHPGYGTFSVSLEGETLFAHFPLSKFRLEYVGDNTFFDHNAIDIPHTYWNFMRLNFIQDDNNRVKSVLINLDNSPVEFARVQ